MFDRDYDAVLALLDPAGDLERRMTSVVDALWQTLHTRGVSWVGFYLDVPDAADDRRLVLGPHRDTPACSPIGLHGVCGQAHRTRATAIVDDVTVLGEAYVACDPRDRSEIVIPLLDRDGACWAVLDLDSREIGAFTPDDETGLRRVLQTIGLAEAEFDSPQFEMEPKPPGRLSE